MLILGLGLGSVIGLGFRLGFGFGFGIGNLNIFDNVAVSPQWTFPSARRLLFMLVTPSHEVVTAAAVLRHCCVVSGGISGS